MLGVSLRLPASAVGIATRPFLTSLAPDADCKNKNSALKVISLSKGVQSNFTQGECLRLEIVFFIVLFSNRSRKGERRDGGKEGKRNEKDGRSIKAALSGCLYSSSFVPGETRFRPLMAAGHVRGALKCRKGTCSFPINRPAGRETLAQDPNITMTRMARSRP